MKGCKKKNLVRVMQVLGRIRDGTQGAGPVAGGGKGVRLRTRMIGKKGKRVMNCAGKPRGERSGVTEGSGCGKGNNFLSRGGRVSSWWVGTGGWRGLTRLEKLDLIICLEEIIGWPGYHRRSGLLTGPRTWSWGGSL